MLNWLKLLLTLFNNTIAYLHTKQLINKGRDEAFLAIEEETNQILQIQRDTIINSMDDAIEQLSHKHTRENNNMPTTTLHHEE